MSAGWTTGSGGWTPPRVGRRRGSVRVTPTTQTNMAHTSGVKRRGRGWRPRTRTATLSSADDARLVRAMAGRAPSSGVDCQGGRGLRSIDDGWAGRTLYYWSQQREGEERRTVLCSIPSDERQLPYGSTAALCSSPKHIRIFMLGWFPTRFFGEVGGVYLCRFVTLRNTCKL